MDPSQPTNQKTDYGFIMEQPTVAPPKKRDKRIILLIVLAALTLLIVVTSSVLGPSKKEQVQTTNQATRTEGVKAFLTSAKRADTQAVFDAFAPAYRPKDEAISRTIIKPLANYDIDNCKYEESSNGATESQRVVLATCPVSKSNQKVILSTTTVTINGVVKVIAVGAVGVKK